MKSLKSIAMLCVASLSLSACGGEGWEREFKKACVDAVKESLKSPSSMKLIDYTAERHPTEHGFYLISVEIDKCRTMNPSDALECANDVAALTEAILQNIDERKADGTYKPPSRLVEVIPDYVPHRYVADITYDAVNSYNANIRGKTECEFITETGRIPASFNPVRLLE